MQTRSFPADPAGVRSARGFLEQVLTAADVDPWPATLLLSELATNVVRYAPGGFTVRVSISSRADPRVRVEVVDGSAVVPAVRDAALDEERGRGLQLVEVFASQWGVDERGDAGKAVWFEVGVGARDGAP